VQKQKELDQLALDAVESNSLPTLLVQSYFGGLGTGESCALCGNAIEQSDVSAELEAAQGSLVFHTPCFIHWQLAVQAVLDHPTSAGPDTTHCPHLEEAHLRRRTGHS
jgi:hypothetical protein